MSKSNESNKLVKSLTNIIIYLLFAALILGLLSGAYYLLTSPSGLYVVSSDLYVVYGEENITSDNNGITIEWSGEESEVTFTIKNSADWGAYSVQDCTVKIVPNITSDDKDFEFTVSGESSSRLYSLETDLTAAFVEDFTNYNGNGLTITEDGEFSLYLYSGFYDIEYGFLIAMDSILYRVYGAQVVTSGVDSDISEYPYLAIQVTAPSGYSITIPFVFESTIPIEYNIYETHYSEGSYGYGLDYPETAAAGETVTFVVYILDGELTNIKITSSTGGNIEYIDNEDGSYSFIMPSTSVVIALFFNGATGE